MGGQNSGIPHRLLAEWTRLAESMHPKNIDMGLERIRIVKERLGIRFDCPVEIVGGTNGKGSTCAMLQTIWKEAGYRVGLYTSPHIHRFNERIRVDGEMADDETLVGCFEVVEAARGDVALTFFEFTTLVALRLFAEAKPDAVVLEVGLGGRLDAVNLIDADVAVVTNVAIDHVEYLGDTREKIGFEKAGIYRRGRVAFYGDTSPPHALVGHALETGADLRIFGRDYFCRMHDGKWDYVGRKTLAELPSPSLYGDNQIHNATTVLAIVEALQSRLPVASDAIRRGLAHTELPGRFQIVSESPRVIFDVAHNPHAAEYLTGRMKALPKNGRVLAVIGMLHDKDIAGTLAWLKSVVDDWYCAPLEGPRGATAEQLLEHLGNGKSFDSVAQAWDAAMADAKAEDTVLVCGSFHTVAHVMEVIDARRSGGK